MEWIDLSVDLPRGDGYIVLLGDDDLPAIAMASVVAEDAYFGIVNYLGTSYTKFSYLTHPRDIPVDHPHWGVDILFRPDDIVSEQLFNSFGEGAETYHEFIHGNDCKYFWGMVDSVNVLFDQAPFTVLFKDRDHATLAKIILPNVLG